MIYINLDGVKTLISEFKKLFASVTHKHTTSDIDGLDSALSNKYDKTDSQTKGTVLAAPADENGIASFRKLTKEDVGLGDAAQIVHLTKAEYDALEASGELNPDIDYITTDESDNITDSDVSLWNISSSLAKQGKYLSYSDQDGGKYLGIKNASDDSAVAHVKLMDGESGDGLDVDAEKVKTVDTKGILVDALGETTAQALIDEVAKRVIDLTGRMSTTETGLQSANDAITSLNSKLSWKSFAGNISSVDISSLSWKAIYVFIIVNSNNYMTFSIPLVYPLTHASGNEFRFYNFGMYFNSGTYIGGRIGVSIQMIYIDSVLLNGQEVKENSHMWVFYR